jgi:CheY-like chemotaxis protein
VPNDDLGGKKTVPRGVDILVVDDRAVDAEITILALKHSAQSARILKSGAEALSYLFCLDARLWPSQSMPGLVLLDDQGQ